ncbi:MAG: ATP-binding protein [Candidatus Neomarinimicrobiota bacterium]
MSSSEDFEQKLQLLVVDAELSSSTFLKEFLTARDYKVHVARDGAQALDLLGREGIHMAFVERTLPDTSGFEVIRKAKQTSPELVGVVMSEMPSASYEERLQFGVDDFITKPFSSDELTFLVGKYEKYIHAIHYNKYLQERLRVEQDKSRFFSEAGHQLKTPIAVLKEFTHLFRERFGGELSSKQLQYLEAIDQNVDRLLYLVENIENWSRMDSGSWPIQLKAEDPREIVSRVSGSWRPILEGRNLRLTEETASDLPLVKVDAAAVEQVLCNLVDNASKYGPAKGTVTLRCVRSGERFVRVEVEDQGPGIPEDKREYVFQPFARLPEHKSGPGLGLGLTVAQGLIKRMGGDLWLDTSTKPGNRFCLHLQVAQPSS